MSDENKMLTAEEQALRLQAVGDVSKFTPEQLRAFLSQQGAMMGGTDLPGLQRNTGVHASNTDCPHEVCDSNLGAVAPAPTESKVRLADTPPLP